MKVAIRVLVLAVFIGIFSSAQATPGQVLCRGNIETVDRKILHPGVEYWLWYNVVGKNATVRVAGREFNTTADTGSAWSGLWLQNLKDGAYMSYLPSDGGTMKAELETGVWFSGNCLPERP